VRYDLYRSLGVKGLNCCVCSDNGYRCWIICWNIVQRILENSMSSSFCNKNDYTSLVQIWCFPSQSVVTCKYNTSVDNTTLYLCTMKQYICQGDMFWPYKVIIRPSKKTDPRAVLCFTALWDPKCIWDPTVQWNIIQLLDLSWRAWWWPCKVETCRPDKLSILINKVLCCRLTCCVYIHPWSRT